MVSLDFLGNFLNKSERNPRPDPSYIMRGKKPRLCPEYHGTGQNTKGGDYGQSD
jgi:hypothetical protein